MKKASVYHIDRINIWEPCELCGSDVGIPYPLQQQFWLKHTLSGRDFSWMYHFWVAEPKSSYVGVLWKNTTSVGGFSRINIPFLGGFWWKKPPFLLRYADHSILGIKLTILDHIMEPEINNCSPWPRCTTMCVTSSR